MTELDLRNEFSSGVHAMAGHCLSALALVRKDEWTIEDFEKWLKAVRDGDARCMDLLNRTKFSMLPAHEEIRIDRETWDVP